MIRAESYQLLILVPKTGFEPVRLFRGKGFITRFGEGGSVKNTTTVEHLRRSGHFPPTIDENVINFSMPSIG